MLIERSLPFDAGGKSGAASAAQVGDGDFLHDFRARHCECAGETAIAAVGEVILERHGLGESDAREGQALLALEVSDFIGRTKCEPMVAASDKIGVEE